MPLHEVTRGGPPPEFLVGALPTYLHLFLTEITQASITAIEFLLLTIVRRVGRPLTVAGDKLPGLPISILYQFLLGGCLFDTKGGASKCINKAVDRGYLQKTWLGAGERKRLFPDMPPGWSFALVLSPLGSEKLQTINSRMLTILKEMRSGEIPIINRDETHELDQVVREEAYIDHHQAAQARAARRAMRRKKGKEVSVIRDGKGRHSGTDLVSGKRKYEGDRDYIVRCFSPRVLNSTDMATCAAIVSNGQAVDQKSARYGLTWARELALVWKGEQIVGAGAIKQRDRREYTARIAARSGEAIPVDTGELGFVAVDPEHRGRHLSTRIVAALLAKHPGPLFATTDSDRMKTVLAKAGFVRKGREWKGRRGQLSLWVKE